MIKSFLKEINKDELVRGSFILFVMINLFNVFNYVFHLVMARMLGPAGYGIFATLMSFVLIYGIPSEAIQTVISRETSKLNVKKEYGKMKGLMNGSIKFYWKIALGVFLIFTILSLLFSKELEIKLILFIITGLIIFPFFIIPITRGIMQGRKKFTQLGWTFFLESILKLIIASTLVYLGLSTLGAMIGVVIAVFLILLLSFHLIKEVRQAKKEKINAAKIHREHLNTWLLVVLTIVFFSLDIIIAKAVFPEELAGKYAVISMIGKMIFYGTSAIGKAMLPISSQRHDEKKESGKIFMKSIGITAAICLAALIVVAIKPELIVRILFGGAYTDVSSSLIYSIIAFSILSISNIMCLYAIAKNKITKIPKKIFITIFSVILAIEVVSLAISKSSINQFLISFIIANIVFLLFSIYLARRKS